MFSRIGIFPDLTFGLTNNDIVDQVRFLLVFDHLHCLIVKLIRDFITGSSPSRPADVARFVASCMENKRRQQNNTVNILSIHK